MKRWLIMCGAVLTLVALIGGIWGFNVSKKLAAYKAMGAPKQTVSTTRAQAQEWQHQILAVASLHAARGADLGAETPGINDAIHFESGAYVERGKLLAELRADADAAKLASLQATSQLADLTKQRAIAQYEARAISKADLDTAIAVARSAQANLHEQQAIVAKKRVRAPFSGHLGIRTVDPGQYVSAGTKVVTLQTLDPIYADFFLPQQELAHVRVGQRVVATSEVYANREFTGAITAIEPKVDVDTRNVKVRATLKNAQHELLPGMSISVRIEVGTPEAYVTLPLTALAYNSFGTTAFVVVPQSRVAEPEVHSASDSGAAPRQPVARQVFVQTGPTRGDQVAVIKGIEIGDEVVTSGQLKLKNNSLVTVDNTVTPANESNPRPEEH